MRISLFQPHLGVFGGVRRALELGNVWSRLGHQVTLYHPSGAPPDWLAFAGRVAPLEAAREHTSDLALCSDPHTYPAFRAHRAARHLYYCVLERDPGLRKALREPDVLLAANSSGLIRSVSRQTSKPVLDGTGGIEPSQFRPDPARRSASPLRILLNGRRSRPKKGTDLVLRALAPLRDVPAFETIVFDSRAPDAPRAKEDDKPWPPGVRVVLNPTQEELVALYQSAHLFVAAERKAGWCNTAIEAMACGAAVVCTRSGTRDFARHEETALVVRLRHPWFLKRAIHRVLTDEPLRRRLGEAGPAAAAPWAWDELGKRLLEQLALVEHPQR